MNKVTSRTTTIEIIGKHLHAFRSDDQYTDALTKLDRTEFESHVNHLGQHACTFFSYYFSRENLRGIKARRGDLAPATEDRLAALGQIAIDSYRDSVVALKALEGALTSSGMLGAIDRHMTSLCKHLDDNPQTPALVEKFREIGVPESAIQCGRNQLAAIHYDLFRFRENDGTLTGVVKWVARQVPALEKSVAALKEHGLPTIEGAGTGSTGGDIVLGIVISMAVGGVIAAAIWA
jgi:hypothetical protein